nr:uncharacterized protein LOC104650099 [Saimiri boliviensis boliviensis]
MAPEPGKVRKRSSKRPSVGETCQVHSGVDHQEDQDLSTDCGVRSLRASSLPARCTLAPPPTAPAAGQTSSSVSSALANSAAEPRDSRAANALENLLLEGKAGPEIGPCVQPRGAKTCGNRTLPSES